DRNENAPQQRLPPEYPALSNHEEQANAAESKKVQAEHGDLRHRANRVIGRSHLRITPRKRFRYLDEWSEFDQLVAADNEAQAIMAFTDVLVLPFVHKRMVGAASRLYIF